MAQKRDPRERRFRQYVERLAGAVGHADHHEPLRAYLTGLCLPGERKSIEPMAARVDPRHVAARYQSMHHFVASAPWDAGAVLRVARDWVLDPMARHGPVGAWIVDDTACPKKGPHSVGVARQYCGVLGKQENCQVAVSVSAANDAVSVPLASELYLPESWAHDRARRRRAGVPAAVPFRPKWQIALGQIRALQAEGLSPAPVGADAAYGDVTEFRDQLTAAGTGSSAKPASLRVRCNRRARPSSSADKSKRRSSAPQGSVTVGWWCRSLRSLSLRRRCRFSSPRDPPRACRPASTFAGYSKWAVRLTKTLPSAA